MISKSPLMRFRASFSIMFIFPWPWAFPFITSFLLNVAKILFFLFMSKIFLIPSLPRIPVLPLLSILIIVGRRFSLLRLIFITLPSPLNYFFVGLLLLTSFLFTNISTMVFIVIFLLSILEPFLFIIPVQLLSILEFFLWYLYGNCFLCQINVYQFRLRLIVIEILFLHFSLTILIICWVLLTFFRRFSLILLFYFDLIRLLETYLLL